MSTLTVSNVSDGSLTIPTTYVTNGSAKAWVNFNGTGTIAARNSLNVSSLTDNGAGDYTVNFTNAFSAADYCVSTCGTSSGNFHAVLNDSASTPTTSSFRLGTYNGSNSLSDTPYALTAIHGDLA